MDIFDFKCFVELVTTHHYSNAADNLHISESSFSRRIRKIEEELCDVKLIERSTRKVVLTEAGMAFYEYAIKIVENYDKMIDELRNYGPEAGRMVNFGTIRISAVPELNNRLLEYVKENLMLKLHIVEAGTQKLVEDFKRSLYDLILFVDSGSILPSEDITVYNLYQEEVYLIVNKTHPLAKKKSVRPVEIENENFVMLTNSSSMTELFKEYCTRNHIHPHVTQDCWAHDMQLAFVREKLGVTLMTKNLAYSYRYADDLAFVSLQEPMMRQVSLAVHNRALRRESVRQLVDNLLRDFQKN